MSSAENVHAIGYWQSAQIVTKTPELLADLQNARDTLLPNLADMSGNPMIAVHARRLWKRVVTHCTYDRVAIQKQAMEMFHPRVFAHRITKQERQG